MLLQANDFLHLYEHHGVELQVGGSDQWGNIVAGVDLIRRRLASQAFAMTYPLITQADGHEVRQVGGGAVWLDPARTSPYQFRQFWVQFDDAAVGTYLKMLSLRPLDEIEELMALQAASPEKRPAQRALAEEMTTLVHGADAAAARREPPTCCSAQIPVEPRRRLWRRLQRRSRWWFCPIRWRGYVYTNCSCKPAHRESNSEVSRLLGQGAVRAGNRVLDSDGLVSASDLLRGRFRSYAKASAISSSENL